MNYSKSRHIYEDQHHIITKDKYQFILQPKPVNPNSPFTRAYYFPTANGMIEELSLREYKDLQGIDKAYRSRLIRQAGKLEI